MAAKKQGLIPVLLLVLLVNLAASSRGLQSNLLSSLYSKNTDLSKPIVVALDNSALVKQLASANLDSSLVDVDQGNKNAVPYVYIYQLGQSNSNNVKSKRPYQGNRDRKSRYYSGQYRTNRYRSRNNDRYSRDSRDRYRNEYEDRYQARNDRYKHRHLKYDDRYDRPLRSNDQNQRGQDQDREDKDRRDRLQDDRVKNDRDQEDRDRRDREQDERDRRDRNQQSQQRKDRIDGDQMQNHGRTEKQTFKADGSAQAQIPVIKSLLRTLSCNARDECQDTCSGPEKNDCEDECEDKYDCQEEKEEEDDDDDDDNDDDDDTCDTCNTKSSCGHSKNNGSTKGERISTEAPKCKRC